MNIIDTYISGVKIVESTVFQDDRGAFSRLFCKQEMESIFGDRSVLQINHSITSNVGAVRGLHFQQFPYAEMKIVRCLKGRVFDVAVDLRQESPTFLKWTSVELTPENRFSFVIPEGCAHGFQVLEKASELLYLHTEFYRPGSEGAVRYDDPMIGIKWPKKPVDLSSKDLSHLYLKDDFKGIVL